MPPEDDTAPTSQASAPSSSGAGSQSQPSPVTTGSGQPDTTPSSTAPGSGTPTPAEATRPDWLPEDFWDATGKAIKGTDLRAQFDELRAFKAAEDVKAATRPKNADEYKVALPKEFKAPEGIEFAFKDDDPLLSQARAWAHSKGLSQEDFEQALSLYAGAQVGTAATIKAAREAEIAKLGPSAQGRVDSVITWLKAVVGDDSAKALTSMMVTADIVGGLEKIITRFGNQGTGGFTARGREPDTQRAPSDEEWGRMSYHEKAVFQRQAAARSTGNSGRR